MPTKSNSNTQLPTRRRLLQAVALAAAQSTLACNQTEPEHRFSVEALREVSRVHGTGLSPERLEVVRPAVEQNLSEIEALRRFDLNETVEPATVFLAKW